MPREARKFKVPDTLTNLYEFANSIDLRRFTHHRVQHEPGDELTGPRDLEAWLSERRLLKQGVKVTPELFKAALTIRSAIRAYLACDPGERRTGKDVIRSLNAATRPFPLVAEAGRDGITLRPAHDDASAGLAWIVAELQNGAADGTLDRLKMCAADECQRVFFDRSKPGSRRWCVSTLCGNRIKTRTYRERH
jgi:predicted RNA-binding Zn ribbon-like protein